MFRSVFTLKNEEEATLLTGEFEGFERGRMNALSDIGAREGVTATKVTDIRKLWRGGEQRVCKEKRPASSFFPYPVPWPRRRLSPRSVTPSNFFFNLIEGGKEARSWLGIVEDDKASRRVPRRNGHWPVEKREGIGSG